MSIRNLLLSCGGFFAAVSLFSCQRSPEQGGPTESKGDAKIDFVTEVKPLIEAHCIRCHNNESLFGGLNLMTRASAMKGADNGPVILPGEPAASRFLMATSLDHGKDPKAMPATGPRLDEAEKAILRQWIEQGAEWPEGPEGNLKPVKIEPGKA